MAALPKGTGKTEELNAPINPFAAASEQEVDIEHLLMVDVDLTLSLEMGNCSG